MNILGINAYHGNASAAIVCDGRLVAAVEEERFNRVKYAAGFPAQAIRYCLREAGLTLEEIDHVAVPRNPYARLATKLFYALRMPSAEWFFGFQELSGTSEAGLFTILISRYSNCHCATTTWNRDFRERHRPHSVVIEKSSWSVAPMGLAFFLPLTQGFRPGLPCAAPERGWCFVLPAFSYL